MPPVSITLTRPALASLFTVFRPNPDGEEPPTGGPLCPIIQQGAERLNAPSAAAD